jgi:hypothetical protein
MARHALLGKDSRAILPAIGDPIGGSRPYAAAASAAASSAW